MHTTEPKNAFLVMRANGWSLGSISRELGVPKIHPLQLRIGPCHPSLDQCPQIAPARKASGEIHSLFRGRAAKTLHLPLPGRTRFGKTRLRSHAPRTPPSHIPPASLPPQQTPQTRPT